MAKRTDLDRLAQLADDDLAAVVAVVESAVMLGDGWLQRQVDGSLRSRDASAVVIAERATHFGGGPDAD